MKRFYALLIVALFAFAPALSAQSASFYNATRDAEKMIKKMPTHNYRRAYVGINDAHINWKDFDHECEIMFPIKTGFTLGYLESRHIYDGLPLFVEYGANIQYLYGKEVLSKNFSTLFGEVCKANTFAINIPVNASLRLLFEDYKFAVTPYAGINFRLNLSGSLTNMGVKNSLYDKDLVYAFKRFQMGLNFGVAFTYDVYTLSIGRVADFSRIAKTGDNEIYKGRLGVTTIAVGYAF